MISTYFTTLSLTDRIHIQLVKELRAYTALSNWTDGRIFRGLGSVNVQEDNFSLPACIILPNDEEEKTTPGQNSQILMGFSIVVLFEQPMQFLEAEEATILSVVAGIKGYLFGKSALIEAGGTVLTQKIDSFRTLAYDSIEFEDGMVLGICPLIVTYYSSVKTVSRNPSVGTT